MYETLYETQVPLEWNGKPTKYQFFDGFTQAGLVGKAAYILGFPIISILMEGYRYNVETRNGEEASAALALQNQTMQAQAHETELNPNAPQDKRYTGLLGASRLADTSIQR